MPDRFLVLRGTPDGPAYLAPEGPHGAVRWTEDRAGAWCFAERAEAEDRQRYLLAHFEMAIAVVPETLPC